MRFVIAVVVGLAAMPLMAGVNAGPPVPAVLLDGYRLEHVGIFDENGAPYRLRYPTSLAFQGEDLLVVEGGRSHFQDAYLGQRLGRIAKISLADDAPLGTATVLARGLEDPIGLLPEADGSLLVTEYGRVSRLVGGDSATYAAGYPPQVTDWTYLPGSDSNDGQAVLALLGMGSFVDFNTTGTMSLARAPGGGIVATQGLNGRPPDDHLVGERGYATPYSSSILRIDAGTASPDDVLARGCRNCYDLGYAPEDSPLAGRLFATENVDPQRARLSAGSGRSFLEGSTPADASVFDGVVEIEPTGAIRRVAIFAPDGPTAGAVPAGLAFAPRSFHEALAGYPVVAVFSGQVGSPTNLVFQGYVAAVIPDPEAGIGAVVPIVGASQQPVDVTFDSAGTLYFVEYNTGRLYRVIPEVDA